MKICVAGACGRMGRRILELAVEASDLEVGGAVETPERAGGELILTGPDSKQKVIQVTDDMVAALKASDVLIDFTAPEAAQTHARLAAEQGKPYIIGTTGLSDTQRAALRGFAEQTAIVYAPNMSVGVNLLFKLTAEVAAVLGLDYNV